MKHFLLISLFVLIGCNELTKPSSSVTVDATVFDVNSDTDVGDSDAFDADSDDDAYSSETLSCVND